MFAIFFCLEIACSPTILKLGVKPTFRTGNVFPGRIRGGRANDELRREKVNCSKKLQIGLSLAIAAVIATPAMAAERVPVRSTKAYHREVPLFEGMKKGELEVQFIPKEATQATLIVKNKGQEPLSVRLPEAFAGVPIQRQFGGMGGGMGGMGGGMGGMGGGMGGMGGMM